MTITSPSKGLEHVSLSFVVSVCYQLCHESYHTSTNSDFIKMDWPAIFMPRIVVYSIFSIMMIEWDKNIY